MKKIIHTFSIKLFISLIIITMIFVLFSIMQAQQQEEGSVVEKIKWQPGPSTANLEDIAEINIPEGHVFAGKKDTQLFMEAMGNIITKNEIGLLTPITLKWIAVFEFSAIGYVNDDEKDSLDTDAMLESIKKGTEQQNKIRKKRGGVPIHVTGWQVKPYYDEKTHNLKWAIKGESDDKSRFINHSTRLLGRKGVVEATLICSPEVFDQYLSAYEKHLETFSFKIGKKYSEYRKGDKIAKYGLTALVVGGVAAVAAKSGFLRHLWKLIVMAFIGIGAFFKKIFKRKK